MDTAPLPYPTEIRQDALMMAQETPLYGPERMREAHASPGTGGAGLRFRFGGGGANPYQIHRLSRVIDISRKSFFKGYTN